MKADFKSRLKKPVNRKESEEVISRSPPFGQSTNQTVLEERVTGHDMVLGLTAPFLKRLDLL